MKRSFLRGILGSVWMLAASLATANPVTIARDAPLYSEARAGSSVVTQLTQGTAGEEIGKQGAWLNVKTTAGSGWILSTNVRYGEAAAASAPAGGSGGWNPFARRQSTQATTTIGIRGFDKETIGNALGEGGQVSKDQLAQLEGYKAERPDGTAHAQSKNLTAAKIAY